jgi:D-sedoheptulose 7-phosphate isomerase
MAMHSHDIDDLFNQALADSIALHRVAARDPRPIRDAASAIVTALRSGGKLLLFGNGGSAADAQHVAAELVGRFQHERGALAAVALTSDTSILTAIANDAGYDRVFARQIEALGREGDVAFGISTSGRSENVVLGLRAAAARGLQTIALTARDGGPVGGAAGIHINVPSDSTPRAQEVHRTLLHILCEIVERECSSSHA